MYVFKNEKNKYIIDLNLWIIEMYSFLSTINGFGLIIKKPLTFVVFYINKPNFNCM